jgi:hypothetical protein
VDPARQFMNPYAYAGNGINPVNAVDPNGLWFDGSKEDLALAKSGCEKYCTEEQLNEYHRILLHLYNNDSYPAYRAKYLMTSPHTPEYKGFINDMQ